MVQYGRCNQLTEAHIQSSIRNSIASNSGNSRNGKSKKTLKGEFGTLPIDVPRDRQASFEPKIVPKGQTRFDGFDDLILSLYARGLTTRQIQQHLEEIYQVEVSPSLISSVTDAVIDEVRAWQSRPLESIYVMVYFDCLMVKIRDGAHVLNKAVYLAIGINLQGMKEVLGLWVAQTEGAKFGLSVVTELKNRGLSEIYIACVDGLKGLPEAIETVFPRTEVQLCIVHLVRQSLNYVVWKQRKEVAFGTATDLQRGQSRGGGVAARRVLSEVGLELSYDQPDLAAELGADSTVLSLPGRNPPGHLYDQCDRVSQYESAKDHKESRLVSKRRGIIEAAVPGVAEHLAEVDNADKRMEGSTEPICYRV